jgi:hypothetical protein
MGVETTIAKSEQDFDVRLAGSPRQGNVYAVESPKPLTVTHPEQKYKKRACMLRNGDV